MGMATAVPCPQLRVQASWAATPHSNSLRTTRSLNPPCPSAPQSPTTTRTAVLVKEEFSPLSLSQILTLDSINAHTGKMDEQYMGHDKWLPTAPNMKKPRAIYNAASLAYMGDCIYELYARRHFLFPPLSINEYNQRVMKLVRCEAQDILLKKLLNEDYLTEEERDVLRWGKNIATKRTRTKKRAGVAVYNRASSLETLIGYLYLTDVERLEEVMQKLGFSTGASSELIVEELHVNLREQPVEPQMPDNV